MPSAIQYIHAWLKSDMRTLRWILLALYLALIAALSVLGLQSGDEEVVRHWAILLGIMLISQALFIFGAGTTNLCRPIRKTRLWMPVLVAAVMASVLVSGLTFALFQLAIVRDGGGVGLAFALSSVLYGNWIIWAPLLWAYTRRKQRRDVLTLLVRWLFVGSLAELLVCVPAHLVTSRLVGTWTMIGIWAGILVMVFSFGPSLVLLFLRPHYRRERMEGGPACSNCYYSLRGTIKAGRTICPECGTAIDSDLVERWVEAASFACRELD